jgi:hypothetical protein
VYVLVLSFWMHLACGTGSPDVPNSDFMQLTGGAHQAWGPHVSDRMSWQLLAPCFFVLQQNGFAGSAGKARFTDERGLAAK